MCPPRGIPTGFIGASSIACRGKPRISSQRDRNHILQSLQFLFSQFAGSSTRLHRRQGLTDPPIYPFIFSSSLFSFASQAALLPGMEKLCAAAQTPSPGNCSLPIGHRGIDPHKNGPSPKGIYLSPHGFRLLFCSWLQVHNSTQTSTCQGRTENFGELYVLAQVQSDKIR